MSDESSGDKVWQQATLMRSDEEQSYSRGISDLEKLLQTLSVQHLQLVGIFSDLLVSFPANTGVDEIMPEVAATFASFAKYQTAVEDLLSHAKNAMQSCDNWKRAHYKDIGASITKR